MCERLESETERSSSLALLLILIVCRYYISVSSITTTHAPLAIVSVVSLNFFFISIFIRFSQFSILFFFEVFFGASYLLLERAMVFLLVVCTCYHLGCSNIYECSVQVYEREYRIFSSFVYFRATFWLQFHLVSHLLWPLLVLF